MEAGENIYKPFKNITVMKKMIFAAAAAFAMISVSNVFAFNGAVANNGLAQVNDTVDTAVVTPATPVDTPAAPADTAVAPADTTATPSDAPAAPADTAAVPAAPVADTAQVTK